MSEPKVMLIAMPWETLEFPSIQLGTLQRVLEAAGIPTGVRSLYLDFMDHGLSVTADRPDERRIRIGDYYQVALEHHQIGLGEWIFAVPPFRDTREVDEDYFAHLRNSGVSEADIAKAVQWRALVPSFLDRVVEEILAAGPRVVGFTSMFSQNVPSLVLAKLLKTRDSTLQIVFGGANCDGPMGAALHRAFPWVDVVVRGEAERIAPELFRDLLAERPVRPQPGLCYREGDRVVAMAQTAAAIPMDEVPAPIFDEYFERLEKTRFHAEILPEVRLLYETARGCWWGEKLHCTFCGLNGSSMAFRSKSPDRAIEDLRSLAGRYGRLNFQAVDNIMDFRYLQEVLPRLRDAGYDFNIFHETKSNLKKEQVRLLREAGIHHVQPGIESFSTTILKLMRKGVTGFQNIRLLKWCAEYGLRVYWNIVYGFPGEPPQEYTRMAEVMRALTHLEPPRLGRLRLDRFSPYHQRPKELGVEILGPATHYQFCYPADDATLIDLAYSFEFRYADGRNPEAYVDGVRQVIEQWFAHRATGYRSLRYRRGPGFLRIRDRRPNLEAADYSFDEREAQIYLACDDGATLTEVCDTVRVAGCSDLTLEDVRDFLDELVAARLVYEEGGRYLGLALPASLPEAI